VEGITSDSLAQFARVRKRCGVWIRLRTGGVCALWGFFLLPVAEKRRSRSFFLALLLSPPARFPHRQTMSVIADTHAATSVAAPIPAAADGPFPKRILLPEVCSCLHCKLAALSAMQLLPGLHAHQRDNGGAVCMFSHLCAG
jgi:hypothetical protein